MSSEYKDWRDRLATANDPAFWPIEAVDAMLAEGKAQFWATDKAALVTHVVEYPGGAVALEAIAGAGEKMEMAVAIGPFVEGQARGLGITHLKVAGRPGWNRVMKPHGWALHQEIIVKELVDG